MTQRRNPGAKNESDSRADMDNLCDVMAASERRRIHTKSAGRMWIVLRPCFRGFAVMWA
jgi:hypothetical protein